MRQVGGVRVALAIVVLCCALVLAGGLVAGQDGNEIQGSDSAVEEAIDNNTSASVVPPRDNITVITADSSAFLTDAEDARAARLGSNLIAFAPNGSIYYHTTDHTVYWDVDPVQNTSTTVEYVYSDHLEGEACSFGRACTRNGVERLNLTTGETTAVFSRITPNVSETRWHDVDRIDEDRLLVADIDEDRAFVVNTTTDETVWEWDAETDFNTSSGGDYPDDWTHINDVEYIELDGEPTVMVSVRNHDQVVFVDMEDGLLENWTLGADEEHRILYEQHNPDYIPPENGGPAVIVADSENGRAVEYQRRNGSWEQTWEWRDARMTWPRDADRLPNGHTLIADSNGDRVLEVDENGTVVWSLDIGFPYEVERLGTGDESTGGPSAVAIDTKDRTPDPEDRSLVASVVALFPPSIVSAVAYVRPGWVGTRELVAACGLLVAGPAWVIVEWRHRSPSLGSLWQFVGRE